MWKVRELADKVTNVVMNYTEIEAKVREATNDDHWGPTGAIRHELSTATFGYDSFPEVMGMLWKRIAENKKNPRRIYKSMVLLHHLLLNGSDRVVRSTQDRIYELRSLQDYHVVYEPGFNIATILPLQEFKDGEMNVRLKAKEIVELVQDEDRLKEERKKSKKNRDKYVGISSDRSMMSSIGSGGGGGRWGDDDDDDSYRKGNSSPPFTRSSTANNNKFHSSSTFSDSNNSSSVQTGVEADEDFADFNPRSNEFGDFKSAGATINNNNNNNSKSSNNRNVAPIKITVPALGAGATAASKVTSTTAVPSTSPEFADFQSAFTGGGVSNSGIDNLGIPTAAATNSGASPSFDLLGIIDHNTLVGGTSSATTPNQFQSFQQMTSAVPQAQHQQSLFSHPQQSNQQYINNSLSSPPLPSGSLFGGSGLSGLGIGNTGITTTNNTPNLLDNLEPIQNNISSGHNSSSSFGAAGLLHPISSSTTTSILQPQNAGGDAATNNHINNNVSQDKTKSSLKGTTWSDLNISLDDVNLSGRPKVAPPKPTMRQMSFNN